MRARSVLPVLLFVLSAGRAFPGVPPDDEPALASALSLLRSGEHKDAAKAFRKANEASGGKCFRCLLGLAAAYKGMARFGDAADAAGDATGAAGTAEERELSNQLRGEILLAAAAEKPKKLAEAERAFREALALSGQKSPRARYRLGETLLKMGRDSEGVAELETFLREAPEDPFAPRAKAYLANPRSAREKFAPEFSFAGLDGSPVRLQDLRGKVVLLDFWATWCEPCVQALPELKSLAREKSGEPFVLVSVSADEDRAALEAFVAKHQMSWKQCWDETDQSGSLFGVTAFPSYLLLDPEGAVLYSSVGSSFRGTARLFSEVDRAIRQARKREPAPRPPGS